MSTAIECMPGISSGSDTTADVTGSVVGRHQSTQVAEVASSPAQWPFTIEHDETACSTVRSVADDGTTRSDDSTLTERACVTPAD